MCGISGITVSDRSIIEKMNGSMAHRGPDADGFFIDDHISLGHRRLSILDLSEGGAQPREEGNWVLSFNGEIYNYLEIRDVLIKKGYQFNTQSDTEVLLKSYLHWGKKAFEKFNGMWAISIWNKESKTLLLCRDRIGQKPLYYRHAKPTLAFASEMKALLTLEGAGKARPEALAEYFAFGFNPESATWYSDIQALPPGHWMEWNPKSGLSKPVQYWAPKWGMERPSEKEALEELDHLLRDSLRLRLRSDVPLGVFISGGLDSLGMASLFDSPWTGLHVALDSKEEQLIRNALSNKESELIVAHPDSFNYTEDFQHIMQHFDTPFADNSSIPTYWICREARNKGFTVMLGGDGGDELFLGYKRYKQMGLYKKWGGAFFIKFAHQFSNKLIPGHDVDKALRFLAKESFEDYYLKLRGGFTKDEWPVLFSRDYIESIKDYNPADAVRERWPKENWPLLKQAQAFDWSNNFVSDILVKSDRMSMANSIELRSPFLDYRLFEWSAKLHPDILHQGELKGLYKKWLRTKLPEEVLNQPKRGFGMNQNTKLKDLAHEAFSVSIDNWLLNQQKIFFLNSFDAFYDKTKKPIK